MKIRTDKNAYKKYKSTRWKRAREIFLINNPLCKNYDECKNFAQHVDHILPVASDKDQAFWDESNWQGLCIKCHSRKTAREDGGFGNMKVSDKKLNKITITMYSKEGCKPCVFMETKIRELLPKYRDYIKDFKVVKMQSDEEVQYYFKIYSASGIPLVLLTHTDERENEKIEKIEGDIDKDKLEALIKNSIGL